jgi:hypothetical protein
MTTFRGSSLQTYTNHQGLIKFAESIPISHPGEIPIHGIQELSLSSGLLKAKSYIRLQHMWKAAIGSLWKYSWPRDSKYFTYAYTERLSESSYKILMNKFGIKPDVYDSVERVLETSAARLQGLADQERCRIHENSSAQNPNDGEHVERVNWIPGYSAIPSLPFASSNHSRAITEAELRLPAQQSVGGGATFFGGSQYQLDSTPGVGPPHQQPMAPIPAPPIRSSSKNRTETGDTSYLSADRFTSPPGTLQYNPTMGEQQPANVQVIGSQIYITNNNFTIPAFNTPSDLNNAPTVEGYSHPTSRDSAFHGMTAAQTAPFGYPSQYTRLQTQSTYPQSAAPINFQQSNYNAAATSLPHRPSNNPYTTALPSYNQQPQYFADLPPKYSQNQEAILSNSQQPPRSILPQYQAASSYPYNQQPLPPPGVFQPGAPGQILFQHRNPRPHPYYPRTPPTSSAYATNVNQYSVAPQNQGSIPIQRRINPDQRPRDG